LVQETINGGITWRSMNFPATNGTDAIRKVFVLKYDTLSGRIVVATDQGVFIGDTNASSVSASYPGKLDIRKQAQNIQIESEQVMASIRLFDMLGTQVTAREIRRTVENISTAKFSRGSYMMTVEFLDGSRTYRLLQLP